MMNYLEEYDETNPISIETYAKRLIGKTFADVCRQDDITNAMVVRETANYEVKHENKKRKGGLGELIEERFFHYQTNNDARPDFDKAGVELKVTPYKQNKNGTSDRRIYGVGKLVNVGIDCKYKNFLDANIFERKEKVIEANQPLMQLGPEYRWLCLFEPDKHFFAEGVDMDEILSYRPSAFRMLRAFQDVTFIKIDDEENRALKECIYLKNRDVQKYFEHSISEHERILRFDLEKYLINPEETIIKEFNYEKNEINTEMLLEAWMINFISQNGFEGEKYDYVTHQVIASPFKPLAYIDKMDIFAYRYLENFPDTEKPIEKYMVIELKKGKATKDFPLQLMRYVDWISREYAAGDYSLIKAVGITKTEKDKYKQEIVNL